MKGPMESCGIPQLIDAIAEGKLPESIDELTTLGRALYRVNAKFAQTMAIIVSGGRLAFKYDVSAWVQWCTVDLGIENAAYRCHLLKIGEMLRSLRNSGCGVPQFKKIFELAHDKQLAIARIPFEQLPAFLSHYPGLDAMSREQVRAAVCEYLGESTPVAEQPELPGFEAALDKIVDYDFDKVMEVSNGKSFNTERALKMTYCGITLCLASAKSLTEHIDELPAEAVDELLENLDLARNRIASAVTEHRRKLLNN